jgi:zinc protease
MVASRAMRTAVRLALVPLALAAMARTSTSFAAPPSSSHHVCPDGLEVVVSEVHATPLVTVEMGVRAGAMVEDDRFSGVSHLYEHMFFKGNAAQPDQMAYLARLRALGMTFDGTTSDERVNYFFTTTSDHLADQMTFMRDAIVTPLFDPKELERERVVVTGEIDRNESEPPYHLSHAIETHVFWKYPTRKWAIGRRSSVLAATTDMMRTLQKRYFAPNNALLVVTGDVKADDVFALADKLFAGWARAADPFKAFPVPDPPPIRTSEVVLVAQPVEDLAASIVWQGPSTVGPTALDTYPLDLLAVLAGDPGSRFQKTLVDSGACASVGLWYYPQRHTGEVGVDLEATPNKVDACVSAVVGELPKLKAADYFTDEELQNAAHRIEVGRALERETTLGRAHALTFAWGMTSFEYDDGYESALRAVTRDGIAGALDRWVLGKPFVMGAMASLEHIDAGLTEERLDKLVGVTPRPSAKPPLAARKGARP